MPGDRAMVASGMASREPASTSPLSLTVSLNSSGGLVSSGSNGGTGPLDADFIDAVYGSFPLMIAVISILTFVLLARAFRSLLLPAKAIVLNVLSIGAAWGIMELVWQQGHGSEEIWGIAATGTTLP